MGEALPSHSSLWPALDSLLTPALFTHITRSRLPYPKQSPINFSDFGRGIFLSDPFSPLVASSAWPALLALSKYPIDQLPDLASRYLPPPADPSYPEQCLGLSLLLDNLPRLLFKGIDARWTYGFFNHLAVRVTYSWIHLPEDQRPDGLERWRAEQNAGLDYWLAVRFWFGVTLVHSEVREHQEAGILYTEATRRVVELASGMEDPWREKRGMVVGDPTLFPRAYREGPPPGEAVAREEWTWWAGMLMDCHMAVVDRFERYPWLNGILGRAVADGEEVYLEEVGHFGEVGEEVRRRVIKDVAAERWTPLGEDSL